MKSIQSRSNFLNDCLLNLQFIEKTAVQTYPAGFTQLKRLQLHLSETSDLCCIIRYLYKEVLKCENQNQQMQF